MIHIPPSPPPSTAPMGEDQPTPSVSNANGIFQHFFNSGDPTKLTLGACHELSNDLNDFLTECVSENPNLDLAALNAITDVAGTLKDMTATSPNPLSTINAISSLWKNMQAASTGVWTCLAPAIYDGGVEPGRDPDAEEIINILETQGSANLSNATIQILSRYLTTFINNRPYIDTSRATGYICHLADHSNDWKSIDIPVFIENLQACYENTDYGIPLIYPPPIPTSAVVGSVTAATCENPKNFLASNLQTLFLYIIQLTSDLTNSPPTWNNNDDVIMDYLHKVFIPSSDTSNPDPDSFLGRMKTFLDANAGKPGIMTYETFNTSFVGPLQSLLAPPTKLGTVPTDGELAIYYNNQFISGDGGSSSGYTFLSDWFLADPDQNKFENLFNAVNKAS